MNIQYANGSMNSSSARKAASYTLTGLKRWSCVTRELPPVSQVKALHVYDFDNTLFMSPLPNLKLWAPPTAGLLQNEDAFLGSGGWWHDPGILGATGQGIEKEEPSAWKGWWNESIVELVELSIEQKDTLTILLTGRNEQRFADLLKRITTSKKLDFHMICLKPEVGPSNQRFSSTMMYKQAILKDLIFTYHDADELRIYEDRPKHTQGFRDFFETFNQSLLAPTTPTPRKPITATCVQVAEGTTALDPVTETAEVQRMINDHNLFLQQQPSTSLHASKRPLEIRRNVFFTGYLIPQQETDRLLNLITIPGDRVSEVRYLANNILICFRAASPHILTTVGGIGAKQSWTVTHTGTLDNTLWAARVAPSPSTAPIHVDSPVPLVVLALTGNRRPGDARNIRKWIPLPVDKQIIIESTVGEKAQLRIEAEGSSEDDTFHAGTRKRTWHDRPKNRDPYINSNGHHNYHHPESGEISEREGGRDINNHRPPPNHHHHPYSRDRGGGYGPRYQNGGGGRGGFTNNNNDNYNSDREENRRPYRNRDSNPRGGRGGGGGAGSREGNYRTDGGKSGNRHPRGGGGGGGGHSRGQAQRGGAPVGGGGGGARSGGGGGGGGGGSNNYRSLDDVPTGGARGGQGYDSAFPALGNVGAGAAGGGGGGGLNYGR